MLLVVNGDIIIKVDNPMRVKQRNMSIFGGAGSASGSSLPVSPSSAASGRGSNHGFPALNTQSSAEVAAGGINSVAPNPASA